MEKAREKGAQRKEEGARMKMSLVDSQMVYMGTHKTPGKCIQASCSGIQLLLWDISVLRAAGARKEGSGSSGSTRDFDPAELIYWPEGESSENARQNE